MPFFCQIFAYIKKKQYLCTRFSKMEVGRSPSGPPKILILGESVALNAERPSDETEGVASAEKGFEF